MKVISGVNLPSNPLSVLWKAAIMYLLLDRCHAPVWLFSVIGTIFCIGFIFSFIGLIIEEHVNIFKEINNANRK